jgi:hypothetical protein
VFSRARVLRAVLLAGACCLVLASRAYVDFAPTRIRVVRTPVAATGSIVQAAVEDERASDLRPPFAVIARIRNGAAAPARFAVLVDDAEVCDVGVDGGDVRRVDCVVGSGWDDLVQHTATVRGPAGPWALDYLELATHHGSSAGLLPFVIVPGESRSYGRLSPGWIAAAWLALAAALLLPSVQPRLRVITRLYRGGVALFALWLGLVLLAPVVSRFLVLLDAGWLVTWFAVLLAPRLWPVGRRGLAALVRMDVAWSRAVTCALIAVLAAGVYGLVMHWRLQEEFDGNYSGFLHLGRRFVEDNPIVREQPGILPSLVLEENYGYDGQFMYAAIYDPFVRRYADDPAAYNAFIDTPPYRYGRIGFPLLTKILSGDRWWLYPATMIWSIVGAVAVCGFALARMARTAGATPAWGLLVVLVPGTWRSLQNGLPEPVAMAVLLGGYACVLKQRWVAAGLLFAGSLLIRETGVIFVGCLGAFVYLAGQRREALRLLVLAGAPLALWRLYVGWVFWPEWGVEGFWYSPENFAAPFRGMTEMWMRLARGEYWPAFPTMRWAGAWFSLIVTGGFALALVLAVKRPGPVTVAAAAYGVLAITFNYEELWLHVGGMERLTQEFFVLLALASSSGWPNGPRALRVGLAAFWIAAGAYVFFGTYDAFIVRRAIAAAL